MANVRVFEAELGFVAAGIYAPLFAAQGISGRANARIARTVRLELQKVLKEMLVRAYADGSAPVRTGRSRSIMFAGTRAFGSSVATLRGHIIGPEYIRAQNEGATITPKRTRALTIPLPAATRGDGSPKLPGPRSWSNVLPTFIYKSQNTGQAYIAYKNASGSLTLLYLLVDQVTLSKHKGFIDRQWNLSKPDIMAAFGRAMLFEMSQVDLLSLARVTFAGRGRGRRR